MPDEKVHRALADPSRARILELLSASQAPLDATELAGSVGLHANTVRSHLRVLADAGLVSAEPEERHRPGRPRLVYRARAELPEASEPVGYRLLAEILASYLAASGRDSAEQAERAGEAWGRYLVDRRPPFASASPEDDVATVARFLEEFGFAPTVEHREHSHTLLMQHCPFGQMADAYRKVVCSVHLGLMKGALAELGAQVEAEGLEPFARPGVCEAHLEESGAV